MGRTRGALGKKTLAKMCKGINSSEKVSKEPSNMFEEAISTPASMVIEGSISDNNISVVDVVSISENPQVIDIKPKKRGRKPGSKNKNTIKDTKDKQNFTVENDNKSSSADHNNIENYYQIALKALDKLKKMLDKEVDMVAISFIKNSIYCTEINIKRFKERMVIPDKVTTANKYIIES